MSRKGVCMKNYIKFFDTVNGVWITLQHLDNYSHIFLGKFIKTYDMELSYHHMHEKLNSAWN